MKKVLFLIVLLVFLPISDAEVFQWKLGPVNTIKLQDGAVGTFEKKKGYNIYGIHGGMETEDKNPFSLSLDKTYEVQSISLTFSRSHSRCGTQVVEISARNKGKLIDSVKVSVNGPKRVTWFVGGNKVDSFVFTRTAGLSLTRAKRLSRKRHVCNVKITNIKVNVFDNTRVVGNNEVFLDDQQGQVNTPLDLGRIGDLFTKNYQGKIFIADDNPKVMTWVGDKNSYEQYSTYDVESHAYACVDGDKNKVCDFKQKEDECAAGSDWFNGACCGFSTTNSVKSFDVGYWTVEGDEAICGKSNGKWKWVPLKNVGNIVKLTGPELIIYSDGENFLNCGGKGGLKNAPIKDLNVNKVLYTNGNPSQRHEYLCNPSEKLLVECSGSYPSFSESFSFNSGEQEKKTGMYCSSDGSWKNVINDEKTCEDANFYWTGSKFYWTGSKCCGDVSGESYEDPGTDHGACWNGELIKSGSLSDDKKILNKDGELYECNDKSKPFVVKKDPCGYVKIGNDFFICQPNNSWDKQQGNLPVELTSAKWTVDTQKGEIQEGCCLKDKCWDGSACKNIGETKNVGTETYVCK